MGNLLLSVQRRKRITADKRRELAAAASALHVRVDREPVTISTLDEIAARHGLRRCERIRHARSFRQNTPARRCKCSP